MRLIRGIKDTLVIDDTYNASPAATIAALETLAMIAPKGRKIAAIGDMLELGRHSGEEHRKIGAEVAKTTDYLVTVGFRARDIAQGALDAGMPDENILQHEDSGKAGHELAEMVQAGDCVLVKGSQSMRMEKVVEELMAEPERAEELLVRQDAEWKKR
jgi:UDP-N-acetylmuramoyl-tripeptide--D-alanyl-D-alanine ligase